MTDMSQTVTTSAAADPMPKGLFARILGVIFSPRATYAAVAAKPRALGVLLVIVLTGSAAVYALMSTEVGRNAWIDAALQQRQAYGQTVTDQQMAALERFSEYAPYF